MATGFNASFRPGGLLEIQKNTAMRLRPLGRYCTGQQGNAKKIVTLTDPRDGKAVQGDHAPKPPSRRNVKSRVPTFKRRAARRDSAKQPEVHHQPKSEHLLSGARKLRHCVTAVRAAVRWMKGSEETSLSPGEAQRIERLYTSALQAGADLSSSGGILLFLNSIGFPSSEEELAKYFSRIFFKEGVMPIPLHALKAIVRNRGSQGVASEFSQSNVRETFKALSGGGPSVSREDVELWIRNAHNIGVCFQGESLLEGVGAAVEYPAFKALFQGVGAQEHPDLHVSPAEWGVGGDGFAPEAEAEPEAEMKKSKKGQYRGSVAALDGGAAADLVSPTRAGGSRRKRDSEMVSTLHQLKAQTLEWLTMSDREAPGSAASGVLSPPLRRNMAKPVRLVPAEPIPDGTPVPAAKFMRHAPQPAASARLPAPPARAVVPVKASPKPLPPVPLAQSALGTAGRWQGIPSAAAEAALRPIPPQRPAAAGEKVRLNGPKSVGMYTAKTFATRRHELRVSMLEGTRSEQAVGG